MLITKHQEPWGVLRISSPYSYVDITQEALANAYDQGALIRLAERQLIHDAVNAGYISINDARMAMGKQPWNFPEASVPIAPGSIHQPMTFGLPMPSFVMPHTLPHNWLELVVDEYE